MFWLTNPVLQMLFGTDPNKYHIIIIIIFLIVKMKTAMRKIIFLTNRESHRNCNLTKHNHGVIVLALASAVLFVYC